MIIVELKIQALLKTSLISIFKTSENTGLSIQLLRDLMLGNVLVTSLPFRQQYKLYKLYDDNSELLLPMRTYLTIKRQFNLKNENNDYLYLDFFESLDEAIRIMGVLEFKTLIGKNINDVSFPLFILEHLGDYSCYSLEEFDELIKYLKINTQ